MSTPEVKSVATAVAVPLSTPTVVANLLDVVTDNRNFLPDSKLADEEIESLQLKETVADILKLPITDDWDVIDRLKDLTLVHYNDNADMAKYGGLRGVIVDTKRKFIMAKSYGYTPTVKEDKLTPNAAGDLNFTDATGVSYTVKKDNYHLKRGYEGVILRAFKHDGVVYMSNHKKLVAREAKWAKSKPFYQIYEELKGPTAEELFDSTKPWSPFQHIFLVVNSDLLVATKENIGPGYIVYLGADRVVEGNTETLIASGINPSDIEVTPKKIVIGSTLVIPPNITLDQANDHLTYGYYPEHKDDFPADRRLGLGEFVILYTKPVAGDTGNNLYPNGFRLFKIQSTAYNWRFNLRGNATSLSRQFYKLSYSSKLDHRGEAGKTFKNRFPLAPLYETKLIVETAADGPILLLPGAGDNKLKVPSNADDRLRVIWLAYLLSVPLSHQPQIIPLLDEFFERSAELVDWLVQVYNAGTIPETSEGLEMGPDTEWVKETLARARRRFVIGKMTLKDIMSEEVDKSRGTNLYRGINAMLRDKLAKTTSK